MCDLKRIETNFHNLIKNAIADDCCDDFEFPILTRNLLRKEEFMYPLGGYLVVFRYFLKYGDGKCLLYVNACDGRMDELFIIDDDSYKWIKNGDYRKIRSENNIEPTLKE